MEKILGFTDSVVHAVEDVVSGVSLACVAGIAFANVIARYVFESGFLWADELSQAFLVSMGMFGCARAVRLKGHTQFDMLQNKPKSRKVRIAIRGIILVITVGFLAFLLVESAGYTASGTMLSTTLRVPRMYYYASMPIGFMLCIYEYLRTARSSVLDDPQQPS